MDALVVVDEDVAEVLSVFEVVHRDLLRGQGKRVTEETQNENVTRKLSKGFFYLNSFRS